jgi:hypothetical protein
VEIEKVIEDGNGNVIELWLLVHVHGRRPFQATIDVPVTSQEGT